MYINWNKTDLTSQEMYALRCEDTQGLMLDSVTVNDIMTDSDNETDVIVYDALVIKNAQMDVKAAMFTRLMKGKSVAVDVVAQQVTEPFKRNGSINRAIVFELTDGQTISVYLHNPDIKDKSVGADDNFISYKWLLNKRDVTILVAPEKGKDLAVREVCTRLMKLAGKNSEAFQKANKNRASRLKEVEDLKKTIVAKEGELRALTSQIEALEFAPKQNAIIDYEKILTPEVLGGIYRSVESAKDAGNTTTVIEHDRAIALFINGLTPKQYEAFDENKAIEVLNKKLAEVEQELDLRNGADLGLAAQYGKAKDWDMEKPAFGGKTFGKWLAGLPADAYISVGNLGVTVATNLDGEQKGWLVTALDNPPVYSLLADVAVSGIKTIGELRNELKIMASVEPMPIVLTGKELGDFDTSTDEGKKALREAAKSAFDSMRGNLIKCPALDADVEIRKSGIKKVLSFSADERKLQIIPKLGDLIGASEYVGVKPNYDIANTPNIKQFHTLRAKSEIAEKAIYVSFVIGEDNDGTYHYDHSVYDNEAVFDGVSNENEKAPTEVEASLMGGSRGYIRSPSATLEPSRLLPSERSDEHQVGVIKPQLNTDINANCDDAIFDAATGKMVLNLFLQIKDPVTGEWVNVSDEDEGNAKEDETRLSVSKKVEIRQAVEFLKKNYFGGKSDGVVVASEDGAFFQSTSNSKQAITRVTNQFEREHGGWNAFYADKSLSSNYAASKVLESLNVNVDKSDPDGFIPSWLSVGDIYNMRANGDFVVAAEIKSFNGLLMGKDEPTISLSSRHTSYNYALSEFKKRIDGGEFKKLEGILTDFETKIELFSLYVNSKGNEVLRVKKATSYEGEVTYSVATSSTHSSGESYEGAKSCVVQEKKYVVSMKIKSGHDFLSADSVPHSQSDGTGAPASEDLDFLQSIIDGKVNMSTDTFSDELTAAYERIKDDEASLKLANEAITAYMTHMQEQFKNNGIA